MGFKTDTSFLKFLTMGATGVRSTLKVMTEVGFQPIELERYCASNKIWSTKVKRLRLPDILCVRTGVRIEVRAKSNLKVRMSDAPDNPDRHWDVGLRDDDLVAFVACTADDGNVTIVGPPVFFTVADLRASVDSTKLGPPKSASEGAERDREWPSTVPSDSGEVLSIGDGKICTLLASGRRQSYQLKEKRPYVAVGDKFIGGASIIAGTVPRLAPVAMLRARKWDCRKALAAEDPVDRYAAAKAVPHRTDVKTWGEAVLARALKKEAEDRVALELAASAARIGATFGIEGVSETIWSHERADLRMEGVLILSELATGPATKELVRVAKGKEFAGNEIRQAAVWGLGKAGSRSYKNLLDFIADEDEGVALHAIGAFGPDTPADVVDALVSLLVTGASRARAAASAALKAINSDKAIEAVVRAAKQGSGDEAWLLATLGRFPSSRVRALLAGDRLLTKVAPLLALGPEENWLANPAVANDLEFLLMQNL
jgi:HEAT repeat protein